VSAPQTSITHGRALSPLFREIMSIPVGEEKLFDGLPYERVQNLRKSLIKYEVPTRIRTTSKGVRVLRLTGTAREARLTGATMDREKGKWRAQIGVGGKIRYLGLFPTAEAAHAAYLLAKQELRNA
jgi:hypothetical protein